MKGIEPFIFLFLYEKRGVFNSVPLLPKEGLGEVAVSDVVCRRTPSSSPLGRGRIWLVLFCP